MAKPSRRKSAVEPFSRPEWPPIQDPDRIDITGKRRDGGVDLVIVASQPIDDFYRAIACRPKRSYIVSTWRCGP